jgi:acyl-coenzyme A thioesterase PaaI-like protein
MHVRYLGRPKTDWVIAKAEVVRKGRQLIVVECKVVDEEENLVAAADFSMMIVPLRGPINPAGDFITEPGAPEL